MWALPDMRARLLAHWFDERHPYRDRFQAHRALIEEVLSSAASPSEINERLLKRGNSLRCLVREIPPVFGTFFK